MISFILKLSINMNECSFDLTAIDAKASEK